MMKFNTIAIVCGLFVTGVANAECPSSLPKQEMMKCQEIEKSGANYQQWKMKHKGMAEDSTKSPMTGQDVQSVKPAAGGEKSGSKADKK